jgi:flagellin
LNGDDLTTFFNEDRTSKLDTEGATFSSAGLGLDPASFINTSAADDTLAQVREALNDVRSFSASLANSLSIVQTRQTFTEDLVNELEAGAEKLTVADTNEEGAKLLALQTRQQLGVTSLSLAVQSQQSVLRLF